MTRSHAPSRNWLSSILLTLSLTAAVLFTAAFLATTPASAEPDIFLIGNGQDGAVTFAAGTHIPNALAPVSGAVAAGATSITRGTITAGSGTGPVTFQNNRLVMIYQAAGYATTPTSGDQTAVNLSGTRVGKWEFARISTVSGATLNFTAPLINSFANGLAQVIAVPEYTTVTLNNAASNVTGRAWDGTIGGAVVILANNTMNFSAAGAAVQANSLGFRGGESWLNNPANTLGCTQLDGQPAGAKGEGIFGAAFSPTTPQPNPNQSGRGNYANGAGGGDCNNAGGAGGGNGGQGGTGGRSTQAADGDRPVGGLGGSPLNYNAYDRIVFGGGGGAGDRNTSAGTDAGDGGGFVFVRAASLTNTGTLSANGGNAANEVAGSDGAAGGGAGGVVYLRTTGTAACTSVSANGGVGGNAFANVGTGGGGSGGYVYIQKSGGTCNSTVTGGANGYEPAGPAFPNGATPGATGISTLNATSLASPTVTLVAPANGSVTTATPTISGTSTANATIYVYVDGALVTTTTANGSGNWSYVSAALSAGAHNTYVYAETNLLDAVRSATHTFTVDTTAPTVSLTAPANGSATNDTTPTVTFSLTEANPGTSRCIVDGVLPGTVCTTGDSLAALTPGSHTLAISHTDLAGNVGTSATNTFTVDTTAPAVSITSPASDGLTIAPGGNLTFTATDAVGPVTTTCQIDGGATVSCTSPFAFSGLSDGAHTFTVTATDGAGNSTAVVRSITVDATPPNTNITANPPSVTNSTTGTFSFTSTEGSSTFECVIDSDPIASCSSPISYPGLSQGSHTFQVRATDQYGNLDASPATYTWTIDTTAPIAPTISTPTSDIYTSDTTPAIGGLSEPGSTVSVFDGVTLIGTAVADGSGVWALSPDPTLLVGSHPLTARATDPAGNTSADSATRTIVVDTTAPSVSLTAPANGAFVNTTTPAISFSVVDANPSAASSCAIDGGAPVACTSGDTPPALSEGSHTIVVSHTDLAGNVGTSATNTFTVDSINPVVSLSAPANGSAVNTTTPTVTFSVTETNLGTSRCIVDGVLPGTVCTTGDSLAALTPGSHTLAISHTDLAGNVGTSATNTFTVDTTAPAVSITSPASDGLTIAPGGNLTFTATDAVGPVTTTCQIDGGATVSCTSPFAFSGLSDGAHTFTVTATDGAGNSTAVVRSITVDATPPNTNITANPPSVTNSTTGTFSFTSTEGSSTFECVIDSDPIASCSSPISYPGLSQGSHTFQVRATDQYGNLDASPATYTWTIDTTAPIAPTISTPTSDIYTSDTTPAIGGLSEPGSTVSVFDGVTLIGTAVADGSGVWALSPDPTLLVGSHPLTARATDPAGNTSADSATRTIVVDTTAPSVSLTAPANGSTTSNTTPTVTFSVTETNPGTSRCIVDGVLPGSVCTSGSSLAVLSEGSHTLAISHTDLAGNVGTSATNTFTVDTTAPTTTIGTTPSALDNDPTPTFTFTSNEPGASFECRIDGGAFAPCTSPFTGGPLSDGPHTFQVRATDTNGNVESPAKSYSWTVDTTPPAKPVVTAPTANVTTTDNTPTISGTAEANSTVEVFVDGVSIGTATTDGAGNWTKTSPVLSDGPHNATARATDAAGNTGATSDPVAFTLDTTPPDGAVTEVPPAGGPGTNPTFDISTPDGTATIACALDGGASAPCSSPFTPAGTLAVGTHTLIVTFTDPAGNVTTRTITFVIAAKPVTPPDDPTQCLGGGVVITDLFPKGKKATVSGFARADLIGKTVTITYLPTKKAAATAVVKADGSFSTTFKAPPKKDWNKNTTNYVASAGGFKSKKTKLLRRASSTVVNYSGGKLTVSGAVTLPLVKGGGATIKAKTGCTGTFKVIGKTKFKTNGAYSFTTPYAGSGVIFVQVNAVIGNPSIKNKKFKTNSFVVPVVVK